MDFMDIVKNRRSIRQYEPKAVSEETIRQLLEMIRFSVSAMNLQPWKIKVVSDRDTKEKVFSATFGMEQVRSCSHLLILCADVDCPALIAKLEQTQAAAGIPVEARQNMVSFATDVTSKMTPEQTLAWAREQVHIALGNALNGAYSLGLGACPMTAFDPAAVTRILELPATLTPTVMVSVGYAAEPGMPKVRHALEDIVI